MYAQKRARILCNWIRRHYAFYEKNAYNKYRSINYERDFFLPYLVQQAHTLIKYKYATDKEGLSGSGDFSWTKEDVCTVVEESLQQDAETWKLFSEPPKIDDSFAWQGEIFHVEALEYPEASK